MAAIMLYIDLKELVIAPVPVAAKAATGNMVKPISKKNIQELRKPICLIVFFIFVFSIGLSLPPSVVFDVDWYKYD